jgi:hypothetical protein
VLDHAIRVKMTRVTVDVADLGRPDNLPFGVLGGDLVTFCHAPGAVSKALGDLETRDPGQGKVDEYNLGDEANCAHERFIAVARASHLMLERENFRHDRGRVFRVFDD